MVEAIIDPKQSKLKSVVQRQFVTSTFVKGMNITDLSIYSIGHICNFVKGMKITNLSVYSIGHICNFVKGMKITDLSIYSIGHICNFCEGYEDNRS